jgi:type II secretory pathway component GspD/PulD (secretin)
MLCCKRPTGIGFAAPILADRPPARLLAKKDAAMFWKHCLIGLAMTSLLGYAQPAAAQQETTAEKKETKTNTTETTTTVPGEPGETKVALKLKGFKLKHCQPSEFAQLFAARHTNYPPALATQEHAAAAGSQSAAALHTAFDDAKRLLLVRGSPRQIQELEKLVKAFDMPAEKLEKQKLANLHLIPIRNVQASNIQSILSQLGLSSNAVQLGKASVIVLRDTGEEDVEQIEQVVSEFDRTDADETTTKTETTTKAEERR